MKMTKNEKMLILINCLYTLANAMSAVFMNVYLYTYTGSLVVMSIYTMIRIFMFPFFFTIGGKWARKHRFSQTLALGLLLIMLNLIFVLVYNPYFAVYGNLVYVAALILGAGEGLFWLSINSLNQIVSTSESRTKYVSSIGILNSFSNIIAPLISSFIIDLFTTDFDGYVFIFEIVLVIYAVICLVSLRITAQSSSQPFSVLKKLRFEKDAQWKYVLTSTFLYGMRDSLILTLTGLLIYSATGGSGGTYGRLLAVFSVIQILSYRFVSVKVKRQNRQKYYLLSSIFLASSTIVLVFFDNFFGACFYGIVNACAGAIYTNVYQIITMNAIQDYAATENIIGRVIAKETYLSFGRILGMFIIVLCYMFIPTDLYLKVAVTFCSLFPVILTMYSTQYHKKRDILKQKGLLN